MMATGVWREAEAGMHDTPRDVEFPLLRRFLFSSRLGLWILSRVFWRTEERAVLGASCVAGFRGVEKEMRYPFRRGPSGVSSAAHACRGVARQRAAIHPQQGIHLCTPTYTPHAQYLALIAPRQVPNIGSSGTQGSETAGPRLSLGGRGNRLRSASALAGSVPIAGDACSCILRTSRPPSERGCRTVLPSVWKRVWLAQQLAQQFGGARDPSHICC